MKRFFKVLPNIAKFGAIAFLLIIVFNFFLERASKDQKEDSIEKMINSLEEQIDSSKKINDNFEYPILRRSAAEYTIVEKTNERQGKELYTYICAVSKAVGQAQRAQTIINIGIETKIEYPEKKMLIYLAPDSVLCKEARVIGIGYFVPTSDGWRGVSGGKWKWLVRTSNVKVTPDQIEATKLYIKHKDEFKEKFGDIDYSDKLDSFIEKELGRQAKYVTAGMWNDDFIKK